MDTNDFKVKLEGKISKQMVVFDTMPSFYESNEAQYSTVSPTHMITDYHVYDHSPSRSFELSEVKLVSRNQKEARINLQKILTLKGWTKSYFGDISGPAGDELKNWLGAPPEVLLFSAYSSPKHRGHFDRIPVVLGKVSVNYPNDVDYIPTASFGDDDVLGGTPFPLLMTVSLTLMEQHSLEEISAFNLHAYRNGILPAF